MLLLNDTFSCLVWSLYARVIYYLYKSLTSCINKLWRTFLRPTSSTVYLNESSSSRIFRIIAKTEHFPIVFKMATVKDCGRFINLFNLVYILGSKRRSRSSDFSFDENSASGQWKFSQLLNLKFISISHKMDAYLWERIFPLYFSRLFLL